MRRIAATMSISPIAVLLAAAPSGCAEDLEDALADGDTSDSDVVGDGGDHVEHVDEGAIVRTIVDATDESSWIYIDLESRTQVDVADPQVSAAWDLGFSRYHIAVNGGISGTGGMTVAIVEDATIESLATAPDGSWITDQPDGDDDDADPDYALGRWYDYDFMTHVLSPRPIVYVVRTVEAGVFALAVVDYYDEAGSAGWLQFRWKALAR